MSWHLLQPLEWVINLDSTVLFKWIITLAWRLVLLIDTADDRPPSPLPVTTRKPVGKSNSMKRSSTYIPSGDFNKTTTAKLSPQRAMTMCHRRSQSATFLPKLLSHHHSISQGGDLNDFSKLKVPKTVFDTEVCHFIFPRKRSSQNRHNQSWCIDHQSW